MRKYFFNIIFILLFVGTAFSQITFRGEASASEVPQNQLVEVHFIIEGEVDLSKIKLKIPDFDGFQIQQGPIQSKQMNWINGKTSRSTTVSYVLAPTKQGTFTIGKALLTSDNQKLETQPMTIRVIEPIAQPNYQRGNPQQQRRHPMQDFFDMIEEQERAQQEYYRKLQQQRNSWGEGVFLVTNVNKKSAYVNEPVTIEYRLYVSHYVAVTDFEFKKIPAFEGFWSHLIEEKQLKVQEGKYNGKVYRYVVLKKGVLLPQKDGTLSIDPMELSLEVQSPTGQYDSWGRPQTTSKKKVFSSGSRTIDVKPLPLANQPESFGGAVGTFDYRLKHSDLKNLKTNEPVDITLTIDGSGNLELIDLPSIEGPQGLEIYEPSVDNNISNDIERGMTGKKVYKYTIVPQYKGKYEVALPEFSYFDIRSKKYKTIKLDTLQLEVTQGEALPTNVSQQDELKQLPKKKVFNENFIPLKDSKVASFFENKKQWLGFIFAPLFLIPLLLVVFFVKNKTKPNTEQLLQRKAQRLAKKYLSEAKKVLGQKEAFYEALERGLHHFLKATFKMETKDMSSEHITDLLEQHAIDEKDITVFMQLKQNCEMARYAQFSVTNQQEDYQTASHIFVKIQQQLKQKKK